MNKIKLLNGRGQIGYKLNQILSEKTIVLEEDTLIYHTWNIEDKSQVPQLTEFNKFKNFVTENNDKRIIFISTNSQKDNFYTKFKQLSEAFLIENCKKCLNLKFPTLIGKGVFYDFKTDKRQPYGEINLMTIQDACDIIIDNLDYEGNLKSKAFMGDKVDAKIVYELVKL